jgi:endonuclease/exonuclease/phosphatase family metal-dependent hydrolase
MPKPVPASRQAPPHRARGGNADRRIRVATWNIHSGVGVDGRFAPERILRVIDALDADVLAPQEVGTARPGFDLPAWLGEAAVGELHFRATCQTRHGAFGNALLSRIPLLSAACVPLDAGAREPRNAIDARLEHQGHRLRLIATHLGLARAEQHAQLAQLASLAVATPGEALVLLGDFNIWRASRLAHLAAAQRAPRTFPSPLPVVALDRILVAPAAACLHLRPHRSRTARVASDHLPLVAEIALGHARGEA